MQNDVLRKMLASSMPEQEFDLAVDGLSGVLGKAASVVGLNELDIQLETKSRSARQCDPADYLATQSEVGLFFRINCKTEGQIGLLALDMNLINSIDNVLTGDIGINAENLQRKPTDIDAALCRPFLDAMLSEFHEVLCELRGPAPTDLYNTAFIEKEPSPHSLPDVSYLEISIELEFSSGVSAGKIALLMPAINTEFATTSLPRPGESAIAWEETFGKAIRSAAASFNVVLHRKSMAIGEIMQLKTGDVLEIPARALESLTLETEKGKHYQTLMRARLGEYQEMRAAKITQIGELKQAEPDPKPLMVSGETT